METGRAFSGGTNGSGGAGITGGGGCAEITGVDGGGSCGGVASGEKAPVPSSSVRRLIPSGKSGEPADIPSLLGVYRHGVYLVHAARPEMVAQNAASVPGAEPTLADKLWAAADAGGGWAPYTMLNIATGAVKIFRWQILFGLAHLDPAGREVLESREIREVPPFVEPEDGVVVRVVSRDPARDEHAGDGVGLEQALALLFELGEVSEDLLRLAMLDLVVDGFPVPVEAEVVALGGDLGLGD